MEIKYKFYNLVSNIQTKAFCYYFANKTSNYIKKYSVAIPCARNHYEHLLRTRITEPVTAWFGGVATLNLAF